MKYSKTMLTTLVAAAAMSVPAFGSTALGDSNTELWSSTTFSEDYKTVTAINSAKALITGSPDYYVGGDITADLTIGGENGTGMLITNANGGTQTFSGSIGGSGVFAVLFASASTGGTTYSFTGDLSGFSGDFYVRTLETGRVNTLSFSGTSTMAISGTGNISSNNYVVYGATTGSVSVANSSISAKSLTFGGGADYTVSSSLSGSNATAANNTLAVSAGSATFTGTVSNFGSATVADGASLIVADSGKLTVGTVGGTITLKDSASIEITTVNSGSGKITYDFNNTSTLVGVSSIELENNTQADAIVNEGTGTITVSGTTGIADGYTGIVVLKNLQLNGFTLNAQSANTTMRGVNFQVAGSTLGFAGFTGYFNIQQNNGSSDKNLYLEKSYDADGNEVSAVKLTGGYSNSTATFSGKITGDGTFEHNASATQSYLFSGDLTEFTGSFKRVTGGGALTFGNGGEGSTSGSVSGTGTIDWGTTSGVVYNYSNDVYAGNTISGATKLTKQGAGTLTLTGANTFTGGVTVSAGTLDAANTSALGTGAVSVEASASLKLSVANVSADSVTFAEGAKLVLANELLASSASLLDVDSAESIALTLLASSSITFNGETLSSGTLSSFTSSYVEFGSAFDAYNKEFSYADNALKLTLTAIPEPSAFGLLAGVGALVLVAARRRRSRAK